MLTQKLLQTIQRERLIEHGDKVLVAFSGGPDSSCLLHMLESLREDLGITIYCAHLNHRIRGVDAHRDALHAYRWSSEQGIPCFLSSRNVPEYATEHRLSLEEAAREVRYSFLLDLKAKLEVDKIAVAHNLDDQAETVLMRILRGTGINGLKGMAYRRKDGVIRPLMDITRSEIEAYCAEHQLSTVTDRTNQQTEYTRNKIRLQLIPLLEEQYSPNIKEILMRMANGVREDSDYIDTIASGLFEELAFLQEDYAVRFEIEALDSVPKSILKRLIRLSYKRLTGSIDGLEAIHLEEAIKIITHERTDASVNLPKGITAEKKGFSFYISKRAIENLSMSFEYELPLNETVEIKELGITVETKTMSKERCKLLPTRANARAFDIDKIDGALMIRSRRAGDKMRPVGLGGSKKLKDIFIDKKIPREQRDSIPIVSDSKKIIWVVGHEMGEEAKIEEATKEVVRIVVRPNAK